MDLKEELKEISKKMYQNMEQECFQWLGMHLQEIKTAMIQAWSEKYQGDAQAKEILLEIMGSLVAAYNRQDILALGDILKFEVAEFI